MPKSRPSSGLTQLQAKAAFYLRHYVAAHVPLLLGLGFVLHAPNALSIAALSAMLAAISYLVPTISRNAALMHNVLAVTLMGQVMLLVALFKGHAWQIDLHMYFFAALGMLSVLVSASAIIFATAVVAVHHLLLYLVLTPLVFPGESDLSRVVLHAVIVLLEAGVLIALCSVLRSAFANSQQATEAAQDALARMQRSEEEKAQLGTASEQERRALFGRMADDFEKTVKTLIVDVAQAAMRLNGLADRMTRTASDTRAKSARVTQASHTAVDNTVNVSSAAELLSNSIQQISTEMQQASTVTQQAVSTSNRAAQVMQNLARSSEQIGGIVELIESIASQINMLALNATIESARAGEAGRGFAVVAGEVKNLATQTSKATEEIKRNIAEMKGISGEAVSSLDSIKTIIGAIDAAASKVSRAVQEQSMATHEISHLGQQTQAGAQAISATANEMEHDASETETACGALTELAGSLSQQTSELTHKVELFLSAVRKQ